MSSIGVGYGLMIASLLMLSFPIFAGSGKELRRAARTQ